MHFLTGSAAAVRRDRRCGRVPLRIRRGARPVHSSGRVRHRDPGRADQPLRLRPRSDAGRAADRLSPKRRAAKRIDVLDRILLLCHAAGLPTGRYSVPILAAFAAANLAGTAVLIGVFAMIRRRARLSAMGEWIPFWPRTAADSGEIVNNLFIAELGLCAVIVLSVVGADAEFHHPLSPRQQRLARRPGARDMALRDCLDQRHAARVSRAVRHRRRFTTSSCTNRRAADIEVFVVGKQWMWKIQHPGGQREIDELHVPVGKTVRLVLASEDVDAQLFRPGLPHQARRGAGHL